MPAVVQEVEDSESQEVPVVRKTWECANCRKLKDNKADIKLCSRCKTMGYCSRECQKADWPTHKRLCNQNDPNNQPTLKLAKKLTVDADFMADIDVVLVTVMNLMNHPENADTKCVALSCHVESIDTRMAAEHLRYLMSGLEPPPIPKKVPKLFQIDKAALIDQPPPNLENTRDQMRKECEARGLMDAPGRNILVPFMWIHKDGGQGVIFGCRYINQAYLDSYAKIAREQPDGRIPVDDLIKDINLSALANPVRKQRLTTMVPMDVN